MSDAATAPEVHEAELTTEHLHELFAELASAARILEVRIQERRERLSDVAGRERLPTLRDELSSGAVRGVQIRYAHAGSDWVDTLLRRGPTIRLIRARVGPGNPPPSP